MASHSTKPAPAQLLDTVAAAEFLGLKPETLESWRSRRQGPPFFKLGGAVKYRVDDLEAWLASCRVQCGSGKAA